VTGAIKKTEKKHDACSETCCLCWSWRTCDFRAVIQHPDFVNLLFIFNDNDAQHLSKSCVSGGGNASVRPHQCLDVPGAVGIPAGNVAPSCTSLAAQWGVCMQWCAAQCKVV